MNLLALEILTCPYKRLQNMATCCNVAIALTNLQDTSSYIHEL